MAGNLLDALEIIKKNRGLGAEKAVHGALLCGFTPLHLKTFFHSALCCLAGERRIVLQEGSYGDLFGALVRAFEVDDDWEFVAVAMEWEDFDPRLGLRSLGGWSSAVYDDILATVRSKVSRFADVLRQLAEKTRLVIALPATPFLPLHYNNPTVESSWESKIKGEVALLADLLSGVKTIRFLNLDKLSGEDGYPARYNAESHLAYGFPYSVEFAALLGGALAKVAMSQPPLKGIVLDLDNTLWKGILGEDGIEGVSWDLDHGSHIYGVFQAFIQSLAEAGILVAVASKNDPALVEELFSQRDTPLKRGSIFPLEAHWGRKSVSIRKILAAWNIGAGDVAFVDDSPLELEEVRAEFPEIRLFPLPVGKAEKILALIYTLRDLFGKDVISQEDSLRLESLKQREKVLTVSASGAESYEDLLRENNSKVSFITLSPSGDDRAFELLNKTNQFNMNGVRATETEWKSLCSQENGFVVVTAYEDRFGPLGKIAVMAGFKKGNQAVITHWVMSCRAFGRRIEHGLLRRAFEKLDVPEIFFQYERTERNGPFEEFLSSLGVAETPEGRRIERDSFVERCPALYHEVEDVEG